MFNAARAVVVVVHRFMCKTTGTVVADVGTTNKTESGCVVGDRVVVKGCGDGDAGGRIPAESRTCK